MKRTFLAIGIVSIALFSSCSNGSSDNTAQDAATEHVAPGAESAPNPGVQLNTESGGVIDPSNPQPISGAASGGDIALNPAHGQPGHRCEIPVGSPLNTPAGDASAPQSINLPQPSVQSAPVQVNPGGNTKSSGRINPPHGEPGHDCAVAVGAPLPG